MSKIAFFVYQVLLFYSHTHALPLEAWANIPNISWSWGYFYSTGAQKTKYACSSAPSTPYCLGQATDKECALVNGVTCSSDEICLNMCEKSCAYFKDVYQSTDSATQPYTGWPGVTFGIKTAAGEVGSCFPSIDAYEGSSTPLQTFFTVPEIEVNSTASPAVIIPNAPNFEAKIDYSSTAFRLELTARYGNWTYDLCSNSGVENEPTAQSPLPTKVTYPCTTVQGKASVESFQTIGLQPTFSTIIFTGTYQQVLEAVQQVEYTPQQYVNSLRLQAKHLSPISCLFQPFETVIFNLTIGQCQSGNCNVLSDKTSSVQTPFEVLVNIIAYNNMPTISDPQLCYFRPGCGGNIRFVTVQDAGKGYQNGAKVNAVCNSTDCQQCITNNFAGTLIVSAGKITAVNITDEGLGYRSRYSPILVVAGSGGVGAILQAEISDENCSYPQNNDGTLWVDKVSPDEISAYENCSPEPDCSAGNALTFTNSLKTYSYYFGQFWRYEDRGESLMMEGIQMADVDATETCQYVNQFCTQLDFLVRAQLGAPSLNRITDISLYTSLRSEYDWNSNLYQANDALKILRYAIELPQFLGPTSTVLGYNSQAVGARPEFVVVGVNDQGYTGASGMSQCFKGEPFRGMGDSSSLSCGLRINVTVVAVNHAPIITTPADSYYTPRENYAIVIESLGVTDEDVDEVTTSAMALHDWISAPSNANYLNQIKIRLTVEKGILLLSPSARDLTATMNATQLWLTFSRHLAGHDTCRIKRCIAEPILCSRGSIYPPVLYQQVCSFRQNTPQTAQFAESSCEGENCTCLMLDDCSSTGDILIYLNTSKELRGGLGGQLQYLALVYDTLPAVDANCGGMPYFVSPNNFSWGKPCVTSMDCQAPKMLPTCIPGVTCRCCSDITIVCSSKWDCFDYTPYDTCGCYEGLDPPCSATGGCFCCNNMSIPCSVDAQCGPHFVGADLGNRSKCGCDPNRQSVCGPFGQAMPDGDPALLVGSASLLSGGTPCQYHGADSDTCLPPFTMSLGTQQSDVVALLQTDGSSTMELFGPLSDINAALASIRYNTSNPHYPNYNKRYRPPIEVRPAGFDIQKDDSDELTIYVDDMGNTGGTARRCMLCSKHAACTSDCSQCNSQGQAVYAGCWEQMSFTILVSSTNSPPVVLSPLNIAMLEGHSYSFLNTDRLYIQDGVLARYVAPPYIPIYTTPPAGVQAADVSCNDTQGANCESDWGPNLAPTPQQQLNYFPSVIYQVCHRAPLLMPHPASAAGPACPGLTLGPTRRLQRVPCLRSRLCIHGAADVRAGGRPLGAPPPPPPSRPPPPPPHSARR